MTKQITIDIPEGYKIDKDNSTLTNIVLVPIIPSFYRIDTINSNIVKYPSENACSMSSRDHAEHVLTLMEVSRALRYYPQLHMDTVEPFYTIMFNKINHNLFYPKRITTYSDSIFRFVTDRDALSFISDNIELLKKLFHYENYE